MSNIRNNILFNILKNRLKSFNSCPKIWNRSFMKNNSQIQKWPLLTSRLIGFYNPNNFTTKWKFKLHNFTNLSLLTLCLDLEQENKWNKIISLFKINYDQNEIQHLDSNFFQFSNIANINYIDKGCNASVHEITLKKYPTNIKETKFALKVLFNYNVQSNASMILKEMYKECIPFNGSFGENLDKIMQKSRYKLESHPNIVKIYSVFIDFTFDLPESNKFSSSLPQRLHENGFGRNMTLYLVMKKYTMSLEAYLKKNIIKKNVSIFLASQLLEGISHLNKNNIAHRDLKTNNLLLDLTNDQHYPWLVISDFGCCITNLKLSYPNEEVNIGGNTALLAPEILNAKPGLFSYLDYSKSDLWTTGTIIFQLFNQKNPFLNIVNKDYNINLLENNFLNIPKEIKKLQMQILNINPKLRPEIKIAKTVTNLMLFCDKKKLNKLYLLLNIYNKKTLKKVIINDLILELFNSNNKLSTNLLKLKSMFICELFIEDIIDSLAYFI